MDIRFKSLKAIISPELCRNEAKRNEAYSNAYKALKNEEDGFGSLATHSCIVPCGTNGDTLFINVPKCCESEEKAFAIKQNGKNPDITWSAE